MDGCISLYKGGCNNLVQKPQEDWLTHIINTAIQSNINPIMHLTLVSQGNTYYAYQKIFLLFHISRAARVLNIEVKYVQSNLAVVGLHCETMHICMRRKQLDWCTHCVQEIPKQVYTLSCCKPVEGPVLHWWEETNIGIKGNAQEWTFLLWWNTKVHPPFFTELSKIWQFTHQKGIAVQKKQVHLVVVP